MFDYYEGEGAAEVKFFHVCTDGTSNGVVHFCDKDFLKAIKLSAVSAFKCGVSIVCYCHMSTHSHFVIYCESQEQAKSFGEAFKRDYARYVSKEYGVAKVYYGVACVPKRINDLYYLKNCISYVLMNPVTAGIVRRAEDYKWSSFDAYFNNAVDDSISINDLGTVRRRSIMCTHADLSASLLRVCSDGSLSVKSFVDYKFVEKLFKGRTDFFRSLALTDCVSEEEKYIGNSFAYSYTEIIAEVISCAQKFFGKTSIALLTKEEKRKVIVTVRKKTRATPKVLARILRLDIREVYYALGLPLE